MTSSNLNLQLRIRVEWFRLVELDYKLDGLAVYPRNDRAALSMPPAIGGLRARQLSLAGSCWIPECVASGLRIKRLNSRWANGRSQTRPRQRPGKGKSATAMSKLRVWPGSQKGGRGECVQAIVEAVRGYRVEQPARNTTNSPV